MSNGAGIFGGRNLHELEKPVLVFLASGSHSLDTGGVGEKFRRADLNGRSRTPKTKGDRTRPYGLTSERTPSFIALTAMTSMTSTGIVL